MSQKTPFVRLGHIYFNFIIYFTSTLIPTCVKFHALSTEHKMETQTYSLEAKQTMVLMQGNFVQYEANHIIYRENRGKQLKKLQSFGSN